jgi:outer membrane protein OmpA-like peptidoglycan-associated protein
VWGIGLTPTVGYHLTSAVSVEGLLLTGWLPQLNRVDEQTVNFVTPIAAVVVSSLRGRFQPYVTAGAGYEIYRFIQPEPPAQSQHYPIAHAGVGFRYLFAYNAGIRADITAQLSSHRPTFTGLLTGVSWYLGRTKPSSGTAMLMPMPMPAGPARVDTIRTTVMVHDTVPVVRTRVDTVTRTRVDTVRLSETPVAVLRGVLFAVDRADLLPTARPVLDSLVRRLTSGDLRDAGIVIEGHTDGVGSADYNLLLGMRRAQAVRDYLSGNGVSNDRLRVRSAGETDLVASDATLAGRQENRRVIILRIR